MDYKTKKMVCIWFIALCAFMIFAISQNGGNTDKPVAYDYTEDNSSSDYSEVVKETQTVSKPENTKAETYTYSGLPYPGMREWQLESTSLGKPDKVTPCKDFDVLVPRARSKEYEWNMDSTDYFSVTVFYRLHHSKNSNDYEDLPANNGYVYSISYYDKVKESRVYKDIFDE